MMLVEFVFFLPYIMLVIGLALLGYGYLLRQKK